MGYGENIFIDLRPSEEGERERIEITNRMETCPVCGMRERLIDSPKGRMCNVCYEGIFAEE